MTITAQQVKTLREKTGCGLLDCKKALAENDGNIDKAVEHLRKKGLSDIAKRSGRATDEGVVAAKTSNDGKLAVMAGINCETDFVAKTEDFKKLANDIATYALSNPDKEFESDTTIKEMISIVAPKVGENVTIKKIVVYKLQKSGALGYYIHSDNKKAAIVELGCDTDKQEELKNIAKELALQIVAMNPQWVKPEDAAKEVVEKEK
jgi:elongation factor Ts